jgi:hypothetical protein
MEADMTKLELLDKVVAVNKAVESGELSAIAIALGITPEMSESMSLQDIMQAMTVRLADLNKLMEAEL